MYRLLEVGEKIKDDDEYYDITDREWYTDISSDHVEKDHNPMRRKIDNTLQFIECSTCAEKPGWPPLCDSCFTNRSTIAGLKMHVEELKKKIEANKVKYEIKLRKAIEARPTSKEPHSITLNQLADNKYNVFRAEIAELASTIQCSEVGRNGRIEECLEILLQAAKNENVHK